MFVRFELFKLWFKYRYLRYIKGMKKEEARELIATKVISLMIKRTIIEAVEDVLEK